MSSQMAQNLDSKVCLNDGVAMPLFGLGCGQGKITRPPGVSMRDYSNTEEAIRFALQHGHRLLDTAQNYQNEDQVGQAMVNSGVAREDVFLVDKVWVSNMGYSQCHHSILESLHKLKTTYIDLMLIHSPHEGKVLETYQALLDLKQQGVIRSVGVSNFGIQHLDALEKTDLPRPSVNQIELHPCLPQQSVVDCCKERNIAVMGYCPLAKMKCKDEPALVDAAKRQGKTVPQVMIRWSVQHGYITIPKSCKPERILQNSDVFNFTLSDKDLRNMEGLPACRSTWNVINTPWIN